MNFLIGLLSGLICVLVALGGRVIMIPLTVPVKSGDPIVQSSACPALTNLSREL